MGDKRKISKAITVAVQYGGIDGSHHKDWVIDQMVRCLTGCPTVKMVNKHGAHGPFEFEGLGKSDEYEELIREAKHGEDGDDTYSWSEGIAP